MCSSMKYVRFMSSAMSYLINNRTKAFRARLRIAESKVQLGARRNLGGDPLPSA